MSPESTRGAHVDNRPDLKITDRNQSVTSRSVCSHSGRIYPFAYSVTFYLHFSKIYFYNFFCDLY